MAHDDQEIMDVALDLFSQKGYSSVSTRELAQAAGITETTLFRKFVSKFNLFRCISKAATEADETVAKIRALPCDDREAGVLALLGLLRIGNQKTKKVFKMLVNSPTLLDDQFRCDEVNKVMALHEEVRQYLLRLPPGTEGQDESVLAWQIINQLIGHFLMVEVLGLPQDSGAIVRDFAKRITR